MNFFDFFLLGAYWASAIVWFIIGFATYLALITAFVWAIRVIVNTIPRLINIRSMAETLRRALGRAN